jgi:hypothetical protein
MLPFKLVYTDDYDLNLGAHVFPAVKYRMIHAKLLKDGLAAADDFLEPQPAPDDDMLRVHTQEWVRKLKTGKLDPWEVMRLEVPYSPQLVRAFWLSAGGAILGGQPRRRLPPRLPRPRRRLLRHQRRRRRHPPPAGRGGAGDRHGG